MEQSLNDNANPNIIAGAKLPTNRTSPDFRAELAMKSYQLDSFRKLCSLCKSEADFVETLTYLLTLIAHLQHQTA